MSKKTKSTTGPSKVALPYLQQASGALSSAYNPSAVSSIDQTLQNNAGTVLGQTLNNAGLGAASAYDQGVLGQSADPTQNPLFMNALHTVNGTTADAVNGAIGTRGLAGGSAQTELLANELGKTDNSALLSQYNQNITDQQAAATNSTAVANSQNSGINAYLAYLTGTAELPTSVASDYANGIDNIWGKATTSTSTPSLGSTLGSVIGSGLSGWASGGFKMASDRRLKTDIVKIGEEPDGLSIYRYRYKSGGPERAGVMADEVAQLRPWALGPTIAGFATVDYGVL